MIETKPLPALALTAIQYAQREFQRTVDKIGSEALDAMGLEGEWRVDFTNGVVFREVKEEKAA